MRIDKITHIDQIAVIRRELAKYLSSNGTDVDGVAIMSYHLLREVEQEPETSNEEIRMIE